MRSPHCRPATTTTPSGGKREVDLIFRRLPLVVALTAELRQPHAYKALDVAGMPVLLTRTDDGNVRAFVNGTRILAGPNWKVAFDGYVDFYHLPILHKNTFGPDMSPDAMFHPIGPHQRITGPRAIWSRLEEAPEADWQIDDLIGGVWSVFPHGSIAGFDVGGDRFYQIARLFPGESPGESVNHLDFVSMAEPTDEYRRLADKQIDFLIDVIRDEDYATGRRIQHALRTGTKHELHFGRNEGGAQHVHRWIDKVLAASDDELAGLFR